MSRVAIGSLNYSIKMDASQLNASATLTRQQMRDVRRVIEETKSPVERLQEQLDRLKSIHDAGAISAKQYGRAVEMAHKRAAQTPIDQKMPEERSNFGKGISAFSSLRGAAISTAASFGIVHLAIGQIRKSVDGLSELSRHANALGESAEKLREVQSVLYQIGNVRAEETNTFLSKLSKKVGEARMGSSEAAKTFSLLKLNADSLSRMTATEQLERVTQAIRNLENPSQRMAMANKLFEESGSKLLPVLNANEASFRSAADVARSSSRETDRQAESANRLGASYRQLETRVSSVGDYFVVAFTPSLQGATDATNQFLEVSGKLVDIAARSTQGDFSWFMPERVDVADKVLEKTTLTTKQMQAQRQHATEINEQLRKQYWEMRGDKGRASIRSEQDRIREERNRLEMGEYKAFELKLRMQLNGNDKMDYDEAMIQDTLRDYRNLEHIKKRDAELKRMNAEAEQERIRQVETAEKLHEKHTQGYELARKISKLDEMRHRGVINDNEFVRFRREAARDEAKQDMKRATATTATKGSAEEYQLIRDARERQTDQQLLELRTQKAIHQANNEQLRQLVKEIKGKGQTLKVIR